ncbi:MAG: FAD-dependent oxidoreductase [Clostridiales bacterium]|jgi:NADPH-dependent 2,4-dienoyl-CoA reductase/sulfur reductase-like enzyme/rhodanese-related sulfurtransferase|nr:FAD-dependent oxidoreductase [Clostridiales bacterium]
MKTVIVGGVAGGASAAARLRRLDEGMEIVVFERGEFVSFANCGLPYYIGGDIADRDDLTLQTPDSFKKRFNIDVRIFQEVIKIDPGTKTITVRHVKDDEIYTETYDKLILSPGAQPSVPPIPGANNPNVFTLRTIPDSVNIKKYISENKCKTATIIGGGFIGLEMAENLKMAGLDVTVIEALPQIATVLDEDMSCDLTAYLRSKGIKIYTGSAVSDISKLDADIVILSIGVRPETKLAIDAGLDINQRGAILTDSHMRTSNPDIYAVGDAVQIRNFITGAPGYVPLAGPANKQGRIAADNICGLDSSYSGTQGTSILKLFDMTAAATGLNERALMGSGTKYDKVFLWSSSNATYYPGATNMSIKVLFDIDSGKILGAQIVGFSGVDKRIDVFATAIRAGMTAYDLTELELAYAPPFSSAKDPVNMAGYVIENLLTGKVAQHHWHDMENLLDRSDITLLDVREKYEFDIGHFKNSINIPLDQLRERCAEIDPSMPVYVNCQSGLRSYIACRLLSQKGFNCSNLAGGYRLYSMVMETAAFKNELTHPCGVEVK